MVTALVQHCDSGWYTLFLEEVSGFFSLRGHSLKKSKTGVLFLIASMFCPGSSRWFLEVNIFLLSTKLSQIVIPVVLTTNGRYQSPCLPYRCKMYWLSYYTVSSQQCFYYRPVDLHRLFYLSRGKSIVFTENIEDRRGCYGCCYSIVLYSSENIRPALHEVQNGIDLLSGELEGILTE